MSDLRRPEGCAPSLDTIHGWDHITPAWVLYCTYYRQFDYMAIAYNEIEIVAMCDDHIRVCGASHAPHMHVTALTEEIFAVTVRKAVCELPVYHADLNEVMAKTPNIYRMAPPSGEERVEA